MPALVCTHAGGVAAADQAAPDLLRRRAGRRAEPHRRPGRAGGRAGGLAPQGPDRSRARLRQEHLALAGADPAAGRDGGDRLAGAGVAVEQGLRRRGAGPAAGAAVAGHPGRPPPSAPGRARRCSGRTTWPRPGRCSTWSPPSAAASRRGGPCGAWRDCHQRDRRRGRLPASAAAAARHHRPAGGRGGAVAGRLPGRDRRAAGRRAEPGGGGRRRRGRARTTRR